MSAKPPLTSWCALGLLSALCLCVWGCAATPYRYGRFSKDDEVTGRKVAVVRGKPQKTLDRMSDFVSWPRRTLMPELPDRRRITDDTTDEVRHYLEKNDLTDVRVEVRDYDPQRQWRRLRESDVVSPAARYTLGTLSVLGYTLLPGACSAATRTTLTPIRSMQTPTSRACC